MMTADHTLGIVPCLLTAAWFGFVIQFFDPNNDLLVTDQLSLFVCELVVLFLFFVLTARTKSLICKEQEMIREMEAGKDPPPIAWGKRKRIGKGRGYSLLVLRGKKNETKDQEKRL